MTEKKTTNHLYCKYIFCLCLLTIFTLSCADKPKPAPDFKLLHFDGQVSTLKKMQGKVFLLNFWATYCLPCVAEIPDLNKIHNKYHKKGFTVMGVALDDDLYAVKAFAENQEIQYPIVIRCKHIEKNFGLTCMPTSYLIDKQGMILHTYKGKPDFQDLSKRIENALAQP